MTIESLKSFIAVHENFPKDGISFKDISPIFADPEAFAFAIQELASLVRDRQIDKIVGIDARGFIFGTALALHLNKGFIMCRKANKLPGELVTESYSYEYASAELALQKNCISKGEKILIVDDVLATGNTALVASHLVETLGGEVSGMLFFTELSFLKGRELLEAKNPHLKNNVLSLLHY